MPLSRRTRTAAADLIPLHGTADGAGREYRRWCAACDSLDAADLDAMRADIARMPALPQFHILLFADDAASPLVRRSLAALDSQAYRHFRHDVLPANSVADAVGASSPLTASLARINAGIGGAGAEAWLLFLRAGDVLPAHALYWFAREIARRPDSMVLYADDDELSPQGERANPRFKPDWSLAHFHSTDFVGNAAVFAAAEVSRAGGIDAMLARHGPYDLLLRMLGMPGSVRRSVGHVPAILLHRMPAPACDATAAWQVQALRHHLARSGRDAEVSSPLPMVRRVRHALPTPPPRVSILIPTHDQAALLQRCIDSLTRLTRYPDVEVVVIDNRSRKPETLACLRALSRRQGDRPPVRVLRYERAFNFADINNVAAREAGGEVLCLLNDDTEVIAADWLEEMVGHLLQPDVGVVGARLLYPDGRVQHGGDVVGRGGTANHLHAGLERDDPGYCGRALVAQELSAVTAACLLTWKDLYLGLGGMNARDLPVAFNDVDYCLRARESGRKVVWTPHAELYHHESASRGGIRGLRRRLQAGREVAFMRRRWPGAIANDPFYNPNLSPARADFCLDLQVHVTKPWQPASGAPR